MRAGAGQITGTVYLDANDNGRFDAGEAGAANLTVVLDNRYSTLTDANGRYEFPAVAAGHHLIAVIADNLPLPWIFTQQRPLAVEVRTRGRTEADIAAVRSR